MEIEFDPDKSARNDKKRGLPFELAAELDWDDALILTDQRRDYGEDRFLAFARLQGRLHFVCFTVRAGAYRIISFRKANKREEKAYDQATTDR